MISIIVPVYNEEQHLEELNNRIIETCNKNNYKYEIIYIDDGSSDNSLEIIKKFNVNNNQVSFISFLRNFGQHAAVMAGFAYSTGEIIVTLDADLQNPPEEIEKLVSKINESDYDIVTGKRVRRKDSIFRKLSSYIMNKIISSLTGIKLNDYGCMLRAYKRSIIVDLLKYGEKSVYIPAFTSWLSKNIVEVPIKHSSRSNSSSKYGFFKLFNQVFDLVTAYTLVPIQLISFMGVFIFLSGIFLFCFLMYYRIFLGTTEPLTSFIAILLLLSGITIFSIGIVSEYIIRLYKEIRKSPLYIINDKKINNNIVNEQ